MSSIKTGLIGYGMAGQILHAPLIAHAPGLSFSGVSTTQGDKLGADWPGVAAFATPEALIADPGIELIVIASPNQTHAPLAKLALEAGKHVVIEKPFALSVAEAKSLIDLAEAKGLVLSAFHNRRWDADFLSVRALLAEGHLGRLTQYASAFNRYRPAIRQRWREQAGPGAGLWCDLGSHLLDQALVLFGKPKSIQLDLAAQRDGSEVDDWFHCVLNYAAPNETLKVILHADALSAEAGPRFHLNGTLGSYVKFGLDPQEQSLRDGIRPAPDVVGWGYEPLPGRLTVMDGDQPEAAPYPGPAGDWRLYYAGIAAAIRDGANVPVPAREALEVVRLIELGYQSHAEGRRIEV